MASLSDLPPDQRAVVQLVLQTGQSYEDVAGLLDLEASAVRERARLGLDALAPASGVSDADQGVLVDYLLGQISAEARVQARALLLTDANANAWATQASEALEEVAPGKAAAVPESPLAAATPKAAAAKAPEPAAAEPEAEAAEPEPEPKPAAEPEAARAAADDEDDFFAEDDKATAAPKKEKKDRAGKPSPVERLRTVSPSSRLGGMLLIGGVAAILVAIIVVLAVGGDDDDGDSAGSGTETTQNANASQPVPVAQGQLKGSGRLEGIVQIAAVPNQPNQLLFQIAGQGIPDLRQREAIGVWLIGGKSKKPKRLGYTLPQNGQLGTTAPVPSDVDDYDELVVTRETNQRATRPGPTLLSGKIREIQAVQQQPGAPQGSATPAPSPTATPGR